MSYPPRRDPFADFEDRYRCREVDGPGGRCQLVVAHAGQHILQRAGVLLTWPIGAQPHERPPWATSFPRDETAVSISKPGRRRRGSLTGDGCWLGARAALTFPGFQSRPHMAGYPGGRDVLSPASHGS